MTALIDNALGIIHTCAHGTLASHAFDPAGFPFAAPAMFVPDPEHCLLCCLPAASPVCEQLRADARCGFSLLQAGPGDVHEAAQLSLIGDALPVEVGALPMSRCVRYLPDVERLVAQGFAFFRFSPRRGYLAGPVGQVGWIEYDTWVSLPPLPPDEEDQLLRGVGGPAAHGIRVLGVDRFGIDYENKGQRFRQRLPGGPIDLSRMPDVFARLMAELV